MGRGFERSIKLRTAIISVSVLIIAVTVAGLYLGTTLFWKPSTTVTKEQSDFERIKRVAKENPDSYEARLALGFQLLARGNKNEALQEFQKAYELNPKNESTRFGLGFAYRDTGNNQKAIEILQPLTEQFPFHFLAQCNLGLAYQNLKQYDKAEKAYKDALRINPGAADVYLELAKIYKDTGKRDEALINVNKALEYVPDYPEALNLKKTLSN